MHKFYRKSSGSKMLATVRSVSLRKTSAEMIGPMTKPIDENEKSA